MITSFILRTLIIIIISYIIGSIPTGYLIVKYFKGIDIRTTGSGSTGATNVKRIMGTKWFFIVMLIDALKGAIPVIIAHSYFNFQYIEIKNAIVEINGLTPVLAAFFAIVGHSKSVFLKFTGGKSVATGVGALLGLCWQAGLCVAVVWGLITYLTKYVSVGSIIALALSPIIMNAFGQNLFSIWFASICAVYVIIKHKDNINRLIKGEENKVRK